jgi:hypothetical protein
VLITYTGDSVIHYSRNGQNSWFARAIDISRFFCKLILIYDLEMSNIVGFVFISAYELFVQAYAFSTFKFDAIVDKKHFDHWIL